MTYKQEKITPYGNGEAKGKQVEEMFDGIAHSYDRLNHQLSFGIDYLWRRAAIKTLKPHSPKTLLDIATGTGDFAILATRKLRPVSVKGVDISEGMMSIGREKVNRAGLSDVISFEKEDCTHLSYQADTFDAVTAAFGIRNFQDLDAGLREMCRVLKSGGHACLVEFSCPQRFPMKQLFWLYSHTILPLYGKLVSGDSKAYSYLITTIEAFPQGETMIGILKKAGFATATYKRLTFGICTCYLATK